MIYNPEIHKRKSLRLKNFDYSTSGVYFITISVENKLCLFGDIIEGNIILNKSGITIEKYILELENKFNNIKINNYIVMPNHIHFIIELYNTENVGTISGGTHRFTPTKGEFIYNINSLSSIIQWFKTITTNKYIKGVKENNFDVFNKKLWQKNFYEHIIRDEKSYLEIFEYIENNPKKWDTDKFYYTEI